MQAEWLQVVVPSVAALVASVVGAFVGGRIVRNVAREQAQRETNERTAERQYSKLAVDLGEKRKRDERRIDRKIELLKEAHALYEMVVLNRGDPSVETTISLAFGTVKALASFSLDAEERGSLIDAFEELIWTKDPDPTILTKTQDSLRALTDSLMKDLGVLNRMTVAAVADAPTENVMPPSPFP